MQTTGNVIAYLREYLASGSSVELLALLEASDDDLGIRIACCLAIDIATGSLTLPSIERIANRIMRACRTNASGPTISSAIRSAKDAVNGVGFVCESALPAAPIDKSERYVRIMDSGSFITHYCQNLITTVDSSDTALVLSSYFSGGRELPLGFAKCWTSGHVPVIWVSLESEVIATNRDSCSAQVDNELGLGYDPETELLAIRYPPSFEDAVPLYVPTVFDASWAERCWYISGPERDGWGRTHPCSGAGSGARERVHGHSKGLTDGYVAYQIGALPPESAARDREALMVKCLERFELHCGTRAADDDGPSGESVEGAKE